MKKYLSNPIPYLALAFMFFIIGSFDTWGNGANSYAELTWWGKLAFNGFLTVLGGLLFRFMLIPLGYWIYKGFKNLLGR